jgi:preprotein translocase subunit SecE
VAPIGMRVEASVSEQSTTSRDSRPDRRAGGNVVVRFFASIGLFIGQVLDELRKVVRPTREELTTYTTVVIIFVAVIMILVLGLDTAFKWLVAWAFGNSTS